MFDQCVSFLYTNDLARSVAFYRDVIGLEQALDQGGCRIFRVAPESFLGICKCGPGRPFNPDGIITTFVTADVDGWYEKLKQKGVDFEKPPSENPDFNIYHCFLRDPDGYLLEIQRFLQPEWPRPARTFPV